MAASERVDPTFTISARDLSEIRATHDRPGSIARVLFEELDAALDALQQAEVERDGACAARDRALEGGIALRAERDRMRAVVEAARDLRGDLDAERRVCPACQHPAGALGWHADGSACGRLADALDTLDREEHEAAPASGDPELAAAVARLEGAGPRLPVTEIAVFVRGSRSVTWRAKSDDGTTRIGPLRDVLIALARDVSESPTMADLDALEALLAAATPGPWREESGMNVKRDEDAPHPAHVATCMGSDHKESDARAIVALRNVAPEMLAVLRAAERVRGAPMLDSIRELGRALDALRAKLREVL